MTSMCCLTGQGAVPVYDVHCHMLPGVDDGARTREMAIDMARMAAADGITHLACTPHIYPGLFENNADGIARALAAFRRLLEEQGVALELCHGADIQVVPELLGKLRSGAFPTINGSRYFLFEPPHHVPLVNFSRLVEDALSAGFVPVITHPERLSWLDTHYQEFLAAARAGAWMQITAGSLCGRFGSAPRYWAERMLDEGVVHLLATDAHNLRSRPPLLAEGRVAAARIVGSEEAYRLVVDRPALVWRDGDPDEVCRPPGLGAEARNRKERKRGLFSRLVTRGKLSA
ncbi:tyrosine-protein phosphatase [Thiolapillus sp.]